jgi:ABC-type multidrug transport system ATPase subunit
MLEVKDATIAIGERTLVEGLSFIAKDGALTCLTGPEGSGKTTFIRTLMGFLPVKDGFVSVDGELLTVRSSHVFRTMMVYLPQQIQLLTHQLTAPKAPFSKAEEYAVWNTVLPSVEPEREPEPLSAEDIFLLAERIIREASDRQIIIADEPAAYLTPELTLRMMALLKEQAAQGKTVLIASRRPQIVAQASQVINLEKSGK